MKTKHKWVISLCILIAALLVIAVAGWMIPSLVHWGFAREVAPEEAELRLKIVDTANQWMGSNQRDGSHKAIIDIYNNHTPLAQDYTVKYTDKWCATFVSTVAIQCDLTALIPTECGCQRQTGLFEALGRWEEGDEYVPLPGDLIYYSAEGASDAENTGWSDHVGIVCGTIGRWIKVIEGNVSGAVAVRYIFAEDASIRGYALPDYTSACE